MGALGQDVVGGGGASEGLQQLRQLRGGARDTEGTFRGGSGGRPQLLLDAFPQPAPLPGAVLLR